MFLALLALPFFVFAQTATSTKQKAKAGASTLDIKQQIELQNMANSASSLLNLDNIRRNSITEYLNVRIHPQNPKPGDTVSVTIESYLSDLNKATIEWSVNDRSILRGIGKTAFSFIVGNAGETTKLAISLITNTGDRIAKEYIFNPVGLTILWEADTYTPPFYKGKSLITPQARVRAIAVPDEVHTKNALDAGNLAYVWRENDIASESSSGYGKNSFSFIAPRPYEKTKISVEASSLDDSIHSKWNIAIPVADPFVLFYEDHPLIGIWYNSPLGPSLHLVKKEFSLRAEPYFFSNETGGRATLLYNWEMNGQAFKNSGRTVTLRNEKGENGTSLFALAIRGVQKTFQTADQSLTIHFTTDESARSVF